MGSLESEKGDNCNFGEKNNNKKSSFSSATVNILTELIQAVDGEMETV